MAKSSAPPSDQPLPATLDKRLIVPIVCFAVFLVGVAVNLPVPLYAYYTSVSGGGVTAFAIAFACYGAGVLPALFLFGGLSDRIGRRLPLQGAVAASLLAIAILSVFPGLIGLAFSRFAQGVAIGLVGASATPFLVETLNGDMAPERGAAYVTSMMALGFGIGGLFTGALLLRGMTRFPASYGAHITCSSLCIILLAALPYSFEKRDVPIIRVPYYPPGALFFCVAIAVAWCSVGVVLSIVPVELSRLHLGAWSGVSTFLMPIAGVACQGWARKLGAINAVRLGFLLVPCGCLLITLGFVTQHVAIVLTGAAVIGCSGLGFSFYGGLAAVSTLAGSERARAAAGFFLFCYAALCAAPPLLAIVAEAATMRVALILFTLGTLIFSGTMEFSYHLTMRRVSQL